MTQRGLLRITHIPPIRTSPISQPAFRPPSFPCRREPRGAVRQITLCAVLFSLLGALPAAAEYGSNIMYRCTDPGWKLFLVTSPPYTDGYDNEMAMGDERLAVNLAFYKQNGVHGWNRESGFYITDKLPGIQPGVTTTDDFYLWGQPGSAVQDLHLFFDKWVEPIFSPGVTYKLWLLSVPAGVDYTGPTQWGIDHGTITLPYYANYDGLTGYHFRMEFTAVPEPSSLAALGGGVMSLLALRRRRR